MTALRITLAGAILAGTFAAQPVFSQASPGHGVCVENASAERHLFAAEARGGGRIVEWLEPGGTLCSGAGDGSGGVVSVYEAEDVFEGCSRLVGEAATERLVRYADFDRCRWGAHGE